MLLDAPFSADDPRVLEAVEKQYLYGTMKDVLKNIEKDILDIIKSVMKCKRLEVKYPDLIPTMQLIIIALARLNKRYFSENDMKLLEVFRRRCHIEVRNFMDMFDNQDASGYGRVASSLLGALYALNPPTAKHNSAADILGQPDDAWTAVIGTVLETMDSIEKMGPLFKKKNGKGSGDKT